MPFWKNLFGNSKKETQIMEEPEHDLRVAPPDDLMIVKDEQGKSNNLDNKDKDLNNKDSP